MGGRHIYTHPIEGGEEEGGEGREGQRPASHALARRGKGGREDHRGAMRLQGDLGKRMKILWMVAWGLLTAIFYAIRFVVENGMEIYCTIG